MLSSVTDDIKNASVFSFGVALANSMLCGAIWPQEGMHLQFGNLCGFLPHAFAAQALRNVFTRGGGIDRPQAYIALVNNGCWMYFCCVMTALILRFKK